jgi:hypothetical protein
VVCASTSENSLAVNLLPPRPVEHDEQPEHRLRLGPLEMARLAVPTYPPSAGGMEAALVAVAGARSFAAAAYDDVAATAAHPIACSCCR